MDITQETKDLLIDANIRAGILESGEVHIDQLQDLEFLVSISAQQLLSITSEKKILEKKLYFIKPRNSKKWI